MDLLLSKLPSSMKVKKLNFSKNQTSGQDMGETVGNIFFFKLINLGLNCLFYLDEQINNSDDPPAKRIKIIKVQIEHFDSEENKENEEDLSQSLEPLISMNSTQLFQDQRSNIIRDAWNMNDIDFLLDNDEQESFNLNENVPVNIAAKSKLPLGQGNIKKFNTINLKKKIIILFLPII